MGNVSVQSDTTNNIFISYKIAFKKISFKNSFLEYGNK
jgi:hypothetical protein